MTSKLLSLGLLALASSTVSAAATYACDTTCATQGSNVATCYVADHTRDVAPWINTYTAYPQCYNTTTYVCDTTNYFLCSLDAPVVCTAADSSRSCNPSGTVCADTAGNSMYTNQSTSNDCGNTTTTTTLPTTAPATTLVPSGTFPPLPSTCDTNLPAIPAGLTNIPIGAYSVIFNLTSNAINATDLTCTTVTYTNFKASLLNDLAVTLSISDVSSRIEIVSAQAITTHILEIALLVKPINVVSPNISSRHGYRLMKNKLYSTDILTPAGIIKSLQSSKATTLASTTYLQYADLTDLTVLCPDTNTYTTSCPSINSAPSTYTSSNTDATVVNPSSNDSQSYFQSHLYWIIPVIAVVGGILLLSIVSYVVYKIMQRRRAFYNEKIDTNNVSLYGGDDAMIGGIPIGATANNVVLPQQVTPSSMNPYIYVPSEFEKEQSQRKRAESNYTSSNGNNDTTSQVSGSDGSTYRHDAARRSISQV